MFLLNLGYSWRLADVDGLRGIVLLACGNAMPRLQRNHPGDFHRMMFDPQLYLAGLRVAHRTKVCARLAAYPWFGVEGMEEFDSSVHSRREWDAQMRSHVLTSWPGQTPADLERAAHQAVEFQVQLGVTTVILAGPLVEEREDEGETLGTWIDAGIMAASELDVGQPLLATVALSERALNSAAFEPGGLVEALVDQVTARGEIDGVYIVVGQTGGQAHAFEIHDEVARAYFALTRAFVEAGMRHVIVNFADLAGLVATGLGATGFASGASNSGRILLLDGFRDDGFGVALPWFYSHATAAEYLTESHLDVVVAHRLARRIVSEKTQASANLSTVLAAGGSAASIPQWAESQNNLSQAQLHFVQRMIDVGNVQRRRRLPDERYEAVVDWMESAEANALLAEKRIRQTLGRRPPLERWRVIMDELTG